MKKKKENTSEVDELKNQLVRALADYDNLKKRVEKERAEFGFLANVGFFTRLMPIFDMFESVQKHVEDSGLAITLKELTDKLKEEGFVKIEPKVGEEFDEKMCEAVEVSEAKNKKDGEILEVFLTGWMLENGFIIRPAKVKVNKII